MEIWGTSPSKQKELAKMLDEWYIANLPPSLHSICILTNVFVNSIGLPVGRAVYIRRECGDAQPSSSTYLTEAEPFLKQYAKRSPANRALVGAAGGLVQTEDVLAILDARRDEEGDLNKPGRGAAPSS